jgi:transcription elongation factor Elf1
MKSKYVQNRKFIGGVCMGEKTNKRSWFSCPKCGQKICQFSSGAKVHELYIKCKKCHNEVEVKIEAANSDVIE